MKRIKKAIAAAVILVLLFVAQAVGVDAGELGVDANVVDLLEIVLVTFGVYQVRNEP